ncbi:phenylalanine--tRNA ligase subunit beta [Candidatus Gracilibacteria bacterium]|nr:phenylalanine--tRNA ligase subunit beta [Candidatus Gracilibacteria bacterium]
MKVSYKVLKKYVPQIKGVKEVGYDLVMHTAEVEAIEYQAAQFEHIVYGKILEVQPHENADSLKVCIVDVGEKESLQIVCGGSNLTLGQGVAIAKIGASVLWHGQGDPVIMKKTSIRGVESYGMICASEEIGLENEYPANNEKEILDITDGDVKPGTPLAEVLGKDDTILEIDNKAINHRPDLFSHIGIAREIAAISGENFDYTYSLINTSKLSDAGVQNLIPEVVRRYMACYVSGVKNITSPTHLLEVLQSHDITSKGVLVDISNYSLYLYGQPAHCFDADALVGNIHIRYAEDGEIFTALNDKNYTLSPEDIVIADDSGVIALGGIIGGKHSAVNEETTRIIIESAHFDQSVVRKTGKRLGIRTDALNIFEKNISLHLQPHGLSLIVSELQKLFPDMKLEAISDVHTHLPETVYIPENIPYISSLIGATYSDGEVYSILERLGIIWEKGMFVVPHWRTDITTLADIAEEVARISGYNTVETTVPRIQLGAVSQTSLYKAKRDIRNFLTARGYYEMYTYSFVNEELMQRCLGDTESLVGLKNILSEELSHMRPSLLPNLLSSVESNMRDFEDLKLFECEKVFRRDDEEGVLEHYELGVLIHKKSSENLYYTTVAELDDITSKLQVPKYDLKQTQNFPSFAHTGRVSEIIVRGKIVGYVGEIHPQVLENFSITGRCGFITLDIQGIIDAFYQIPAYKEISSFQANSFDLTFVVPKDISGKKIQDTIGKTDSLIQKVELFDIYESEEKLPGKRALSFTVIIQSLTETLDDSVKNKIIAAIISRVEKAGGKLR